MRKKTVLSYLAASVLTPLILNACVPSTPTGHPPDAVSVMAGTINAALTEGAAQETMKAAEAGTQPGEETPGISEATVESEPEPAITVTPTRMPTLTRTPKPSPTRALEVAFEDDFEHDRAWAEFAGEEFHAGYTSDGYHIFVDIITGNSPVFSIRQQEYGDVVVESDVTGFTGPENGYYGVLCRFIDSSNYYRFTFSADGSYSIGAKKGEGFVLLASGADPELVNDESPNRVRAECLGSTLSMYVNGVKLLETQDESFKTGFIGLVAGTPDKEGLDVVFDNLVVLKP